MSAVTHEVGAVWRIIDQGTPTLRLIGDALGKVDQIAKSLQERLAAIGTIKLTGTAEALKAIDTQVGATQGKLTGLSDTRFTGLNRGLTGVASRLEKIEARAKAAGGALGSLPALPGGGGSGSPRHPRPGQDGGHGPSHREGAGVDLGIFGFIGAEAVGHGTADILKHGMELQHVQEQMLQGGMKTQEVAEATSKAWQEASKYGLSIVKVMEDIKELRFPFGSTEHAIEFIDPLEKMRVVLNSVSEGRGNESASSVYELARAGELKGLQNPEEFLKYFDDMTKVISATGGKVDPKSFMQAMKYGRVASLGWDEEFTTKYLPSLMQSLGPSGAGTAAMSLFGTLAQGKVGKRALGQMEDIGLIGDKSKIILDGKGDPVGFNPGAVKGTDDFVKNPALWAQNTLLPLLTTKFGDLKDDTNRLHAAEGLGGLFGNRMSAQSVAEFILRMQSINKDAGLITGARGIDGASNLLSNDPNAAIARLQAASTNFLTSLGNPAVQQAITAMNGISTAINAMSGFANEHPEAMRSIVGALGGLTVALGALAAVGLAMFLPGGVFVVGVTSLIGILGGLAAVNVTNLVAVGTAIKDFVTGILGLGSSVGDASKQFQKDRQNLNPLFQHSSFDATDGAVSPLAAAVRDGFLAAFQQMQGGGLGGGAVRVGGGGSGVISAAYTTYGSGNGAGAQLPGGHLPSLPGGASYPGHIDSVLSIGADKFRFGSGGVHGSSSIPFGDFPITPGAMGSWGVSHGAIGVNNNQIWDKALGRMREGILLHAGASTTLITEGCVAFLKSEFPKLKSKVFDMIRREGHAYLHVGPQGASITPYAGAPPRPNSEQTIHNHIHLDGKEIQASVTRRQSNRGRFPTSVGSLDAHGSFASPGTPFIDAA